MQRKKSRSKPTQSDVARLAGVSVPVVSAVITGKKGTTRVSEAVAEKVRKAIRELGYVPNPIARSLSNARNNIIGVFTFDPVFPSHRDNFFFPFVEGIERKVDGSGFDLLLFTASATKGDMRKIFPDGVNRLATTDGSIILGETHDPGEIKSLANEDFPFVLIGRRDISGIDLSYVAANYAKATQELVSKFWNLGHRRFCYVAEPIEHESQTDRIAGFQARFRDELDDSFSSIYHMIDMDGDGHRAFRELTQQRCTAVFAESARIAEILIRQYKSNGYEIGRDVSICLLNDPLTISCRQHKLTHIAVPRIEMGAKAAELLLERLEHGIEVRKVSLDCEIVEGQTVGPAP